MATILELAREVRRRLISKDTGCLTVDYPNESLDIRFSEGNLASAKAVFMSCFSRAPLDFAFREMDVPSPQRHGGASLLIEAVESIPGPDLVRLWEPYADWRIEFALDPKVHRTRVYQHLGGTAESLRRLVRLCISDSLKLEPPRESIADQIERIRTAADAGNWHDVLGVHANASQKDIRRAWRRLASKIHPDRWVTASDPRLRDRIETAFKEISHAYSRLLQPPPPRIPHRLPPKRALWQRVYHRVWSA